jgi:hypothetical protein
MIHITLIMFDRYHNNTFVFYFFMNELTHIAYVSIDKEERKPSFQGYLILSSINLSNIDSLT